jgi:uncharacterized damage-inducible protein DinB
MAAPPLTAALAAERERLLRAIAGVSEQQFKQRPAPSARDPQPWSIAEVLAHVLDTELTWTRRMVRALEAPESAISPSDAAARDAAARAGRGAPVPQLIHGLLAARRELERLVDHAAAEAALQRAVLHPERGRLSLEWMAQYCAGHEREHVAQIEAIRGALGVTATVGGAP